MSARETAELLLQLGRLVQAEGYGGELSPGEAGNVWVAYTDFIWIARRHHITDRDDAFKMASLVIASITSAVAGK